MMYFLGVQNYVSGSENGFIFFEGVTAERGISVCEGT